MILNISPKTFFRPEEDSESSACACNANYKPVLAPKATPLSGKKKSPGKPASMRLREVDYTREETHRGREKQRRSVSDTQQGEKCLRFVHTKALFTHTVK